MSPNAGKSWKMYLSSQTCCLRLLFLQFWKIAKAIGQAGSVSGQIFEDSLEYYY